MNKQVLATVSGKEITREDLDFALMHAPKEQAMQLNTFAGKQYLLNEMIIQEMLYLDSIDKGFDKEEAYLKELKVITENLLKQYSVKKLIGDIKVEEEEIQKYYKENPNQFVKPESARAKHILIKDEEKAKEVLKELKEGKDFTEAAKEYSECPSKDNDGDLGYFERGKMVPEFEEATFQLEVGDMSELVKTQFGYHIIVVEDKKLSGLIPFEQVKDQVNNYLLRTKQDEAYKTYTDGLKGNYEVTSNEELLK
ncbi:peptidylprolyl isomerase [Lutibacter sp. B2]|nr:peptidylprolyl isomerase [Lutibacter sp. B2]